MWSLRKYKHQIQGSYKLDFLLITDQGYHLIHWSHADVLGNYGSLLVFFFVLFSENKKGFL